MMDDLLLNIKCLFFFFFNDTATTEIYTLSLHDALPIPAGRPHLRGATWLAPFGIDEAAIEHVRPDRRDRGRTIRWKTADPGRRAWVANSLRINAPAATPASPGTGVAAAGPRADGGRRQPVRRTWPGAP